MGIKEPERKESKVSLFHVREKENTTVRKEQEKLSEKLNKGKKQFYGWKYIHVSSVRRSYVMGTPRTPFMERVAEALQEKKKMSEHDALEIVDYFYKTDNEIFFSGTAEACADEILELIKSETRQYKAHFEEVEASDLELPGMWETADFMGGQDTDREVP